LIAVLGYRRLFANTGEVLNSGIGVAIMLGNVREVFDAQDLLAE